MHKSITKTILFSTLFLFCFHFISAQKTFSIAYNEKVNMGTVDSKTNFTINGAGKSVHLKGNEINEYIFSTPGDYQIKIQESKAHKKQDSCEDRHLPADITVTVSRVKMTFEAATMSFSSPIVKNKETKGTTLNIAARIETFDHLPATMNFTRVNTAGIGAEITADLNPEFRILPEGLHLLRYSLNGIISENSYLMFDFVDANAKIQSVTLVTPVIN